MREDDDKYELKKALAELEKAKGEVSQTLKELSKYFSSDRKPYREKVDKARAKYTGASRKEESLEETKEGRDQL